MALDITHSETRPQGLVEEHFKKAARFWNDIYSQADVYAVIHQRRRHAVLSMVDKLGLETGSEVLDVGCGAGVISVALASRGFAVSAVDQVPEMIDLTRRARAESGVTAKVTASLGEIEHLAFPDNRFRLVLAIGVLPWLNAYGDSLTEVARVLKSEAYFITTIDNCWGLHRILDPGTNFMLSPLRLAAGKILQKLHLRKRRRGVPTTLASVKRIESMLRERGLEPVRGVMLGFGPFSIFGRRILPGSLGLSIDKKLQQLCDRSVPLMRSMGAQYLILAQKQ